MALDGRDLDEVEVRKGDRDRDRKSRVSLVGEVDSGDEFGRSSKLFFGHPSAESSLFLP
jgi:hypothetical protein